MPQKYYSAEDAKKRAAKLPTEVQKMLYSTEMSAIVQEVGKKNQLHIDQLDILSAETGQVMLGFVEPKDYPELLAESLRVDRLKADAVAQDINDLLFAKIRESMKQVAEITDSEEDELSPPSVISSTISTSSVDPSFVPPQSVKREFPAADVMLSQKTVTPPVVVGATSLVALENTPQKTSAAVTTPTTPVATSPLTHGETIVKVTPILRSTPTPIPPKLPPPPSTPPITSSMPKSIIAVTQDAPRASAPAHSAPQATPLAPTAPTPTVPKSPNTITPPASISKPSAPSPTLPVVSPPTQIIPPQAPLHVTPLAPTPVAPVAPAPKPLAPSPTSPVVSLPSQPASAPTPPPHVTPLAPIAPMPVAPISPKTISPLAPAPKPAVPFAPSPTSPIIPPPPQHQTLTPVVPMPPPTHVTSTPIVPVPPRLTPTPPIHHEAATPAAPIPPPLTPPAAPTPPTPPPAAPGYKTDPYHEPID